MVYEFLTTEEYDAQAEKHSSETEQRAIQLLLADNPLIGKPHPQYPGLLVLE